MQSLVLDGDEVVEMRQASKTSACSHKGSQLSSGDAEDDETGPTLARAGSKQSVAGGKKKGRSQSKLSRASSKTSNSRQAKATYPNWVMPRSLEISEFMDQDNQKPDM